MKKITLFALFALFVGTSLNAQKVGHINSLDILEVMPERQKADEELQTQATQIRKQIEELGKQLEQKYVQYQGEAKDKSQQENQSRMQELEAEQKKLQELQTTGTKELEAKQNEKYKPIVEKINNAIKKVANEKGIAYVFDSSQQGVLVYIDEAKAVDLSDAVKKELGIASK
ncbi:MAG: OmpH family outer membrane protein [Flavobacteriales bacterium]|nr:OmpH family outer membrane protein [Flavobacteriales bacterium]